MVEISSVIEPKDWFLKYRHISIILDKDFDIDDPFKTVERIDPYAGSAEIHILSSFDGFGRTKATKYFREVIQCIGTDIQWLAIEMNAKLATDYLDECADILKNISGLDIRLHHEDNSLSSYRLDMMCLQLKTLSLHNCYNFIECIGNWPSLKKFSISEERNMGLEQVVANFIKNNKQLKSLNIDCNNFRLNRINMDFFDCSHNLEELRIRNASLPLFLDLSYRTFEQLRNVSRMSFYNLGFYQSEIGDVQYPNSSDIYDCVNLILFDFTSCLSRLETLKHLTITLTGYDDLDFDVSMFSKCTKLESLSISAMKLDSDKLVDLVRRSCSLSTIHVHTYDGKFNNTLIRKMANMRSKLLLKNGTLKIFVGGNHDDFTKIAKEEHIKRFVTVIKCAH